jgi:hypothetical protein
MKNLIKFTCLLFIIISCSKKENIATSNEGIGAYARTLSLPSVLPEGKKPVAGLYVSRFDSILGDSGRENTLLRWAKKHDFNFLYLYGVKNLMSPYKSRAKLNAFIGRANAAPYYFRVSFTASNEGYAIYYYNAYYSLFSNKFNAINTEYEFWNPNPDTSGSTLTYFSYHDFRPLLDTINYINTVTASSTPRVQRFIYMGKYHDANAVHGAAPSTYSYTAVLDEIIQKNDKIILANYHTNAGTTLSPIIAGKLDTISKRAFALGKVASIEILFNAKLGSNAPQIYNFFSTTGNNQAFITAYNNFITNYTASSAITYKPNLRIVGYSIYRYQEAKLARP